MTYHRPPSDDDAERAVDELQERRARRAAADERRAKAALYPIGEVRAMPVVPPIHDDHGPSAA